MKFKTNFIFVLKLAEYFVLFFLLSFQITSEANKKRSSEGVQLKDDPFATGRGTTEVNFFTEGVFGHCKRLPWEVVLAPSLSEFKNHLDKPFNHMIQFQVNLQEQGVRLDDGFLPT